MSTERSEPGEGREPPTPEVPVALKAAGAVWLLYGGAWVGGSLLAVGLSSAVGAGGGLGFVGVAVPGLWGGAYLVQAGLKSFAGSTSHLRNAGIGSLAFGLLHGAVPACLAMAALFSDRPSAMDAPVCLGTLLWPPGVTLIVAGVVALRAGDSRDEPWEEWDDEAGRGDNSSGPLL